MSLRVETRVANPEFRSDDETLIQFLDDGPDEMGRRMFVAHWLNPEHWSGKPLRGQVFHTNVQAFMDRYAPARVIVAEA